MSQHQQPRGEQEDVPTLSEGMSEECQQLSDFPALLEPKISKTVLKVLVDQQKMILTMQNQLQQQRQLQQQQPQQQEERQQQQQPEPQHPLQQHNLLQLQEQVQHLQLYQQQ
ncbi:hypothetical protein PV325_003784 [Microctonus aethiopoides]|nr:hypothetical protein PV325_003784 [Microctonus aethiopoides]